jgi:hypothetical protein
VPRHDLQVALSWKAATMGAQRTGSDEVSCGGKGRGACTKDSRATPRDSHPPPLNFGRVRAASRRRGPERRATPRWNRGEVHHAAVPPEARRRVGGCDAVTRSGCSVVPLAALIWPLVNEGRRSMKCPLDLTCTTPRIDIAPHRKKKRPRPTNAAFRGKQSGV